MTQRTRIAVTNLAWPKAETEAALALLSRLGVGGVELAPAQAGLSWNDRLLEDAARLRDRLDAAGLRVAALQGWLFGLTEPATLFGPPAARNLLARHMRHVAHLAGVLGAGACVYGAPRSRDPGDLSDDAATAEATAFLRDVAAEFAAASTVLAFEANAPVYGCRFVTSTEQALRLVRAVDRAGVGVQIDTGTVFLNGETLALAAADLPLVAHVHVSEPNLMPIGTAGVDHAPVAAALRAAGWAGWISIEMKAAEGADWQADIARAVDLVEATYT